MSDDNYKHKPTFMEPLMIDPDPRYAASRPSVSLAEDMRTRTEAERAARQIALHGYGKVASVTVSVNFADGSTIAYTAKG